MTHWSCWCWYFGTMEKPWLRLATGARNLQGKSESRVMAFRKSGSGLRFGTARTRFTAIRKAITRLSPFQRAGPRPEDVRCRLPPGRVWNRLVQPFLSSNPPRYGNVKCPHARLPSAAYVSSAEKEVKRGRVAVKELPRTRPVRIKGAPA